MLRLNFDEVINKSGYFIKERALKYANDNRMLEYNCTESVEGGVYVSTVNASIKGSSVYKARISFNDGKYQNSYCSCPYADGNTRICKHITALAIYGKEFRVDEYDDYDEDESNDTSSIKNIAELKDYLHTKFDVNYDNVSQANYKPAENAPSPAYERPNRLIAEYVQQSNIKAAASAQEKVKLVPFISVSYRNSLIMTFKIGYEKLYVLRNLTNFSSYIERGELYSYGKECSPIHSIHMFSPECANFASILFRYIKSCNDYRTYDRLRDQIMLEGNAADIFFPLLLKMQEEYPEFKNNNSISFIDGNPQLSLEFSEKNGVYELTEKYHKSNLIKGITNDYLFVNGGLYQLTPEYANVAAPLLHARKDDKTFTEKQFRNYFNKAAPELSAHFNIKYNKIELEKFTEEKFDCKFYLDRAGGSITVRVDAGFGSSRIDLSGSISSYRISYDTSGDFDAELRIRSILRRYTDYDYRTQTLVITTTKNSFCF